MSFGRPKPTLKRSAEEQETLKGFQPVISPATIARLPVEAGAHVDRIYVIQVVGFYWNCSQHIMPRYNLQELQAIDR